MKFAKLLLSLVFTLLSLAVFAQQRPPQPKVQPGQQQAPTPKLQLAKTPARSRDPIGEIMANSLPAKPVMAKVSDPIGELIAREGRRAS